YEELETYKLLISISGVGPKAAMSVLSLMPPSALAAAVREQNVKLISRAQGIGTKTAQRIVLEMSGKLSDKMLNGSPSASSAGVVTSAVKEAEDALVVLGYTRSEAETAVGNVPDAGKKTTEELIRSALSRLI
ncbi:MAG: Holliday junction branch migration protein RuvA, partial [Firmicutes bacterium]|nr:Holliday junction branch migration protein RuvA [Bacillota bacterium]